MFGLNSKRKTTKRRNARMHVRNAEILTKICNYASSRPRFWVHGVYMDIVIE